MDLDSPGNPLLPAASSVPASTLQATDVVGEDVAPSQEQYNRALFEASRSVFSSTALDLPWESGVFASIFGNPDVEITGPADSLLEPCFPDTVEDFEDTIAGEPQPQPCKRSIEAAMHCQVMSTLTDRDAKDLETELFESAVTKWQFVFAMTEYSGRIGDRLRVASSANDEKSRAIIRDVLGVKSPRTASKRADSLKRYFTWCLQHDCAPWPFFAIRIMQFLEGGSKGPAASTGVALMEALRFAKFVMGIDVGDDVLNDPQLKGRVNRLYADNSKYKPARPLLCSEVALMERFVCNDKNPGDVYLAGCCLFAIFSRSRWSDLQFLEQFWIDRIIMEGTPRGFVEGTAGMHKTNTNAEKKRRAMPLVAPLLGVTGLDWVPCWMEAASKLGFHPEMTPFGSPVGALCRAIDNTGSVFKRPVTSTEISKFMNLILKTDSSNLVSSHSLKDTTLSWAAKFGIDEDSRTLLGHHSLEGRSRALVVYSRDMLSRPLQLYNKMLEAIRSDLFRPDLTRSGWMAPRGDKPSEDVESVTVTAPAQDHEAAFTPKDWEDVGPREAAHDWEETGVQPQEVTDDELESVSSSSSSTDDDGPVEEVLMQQKIPDRMIVDIPGPLLQNIRSRVLHKVTADGSTTSCGIGTSDKYALLTEGATFKWPRCGKCFKGEVIATPEQAVLFLDSRR